MSAVVSQINISALVAKPKPITENVSIGKDILELLAGAMYVDPLNVYREYIQNAADSIDQARDEGLIFDSNAGVMITFDHTERAITIRDNGISIPSSKFAKRMVTIGESQKRGTRLRGFRGVGRLAGLGYCQELIFRGRAEGDSKVTEIRWNGRTLREKMRDNEYVGDLSALIKEVVTETKLSADGYPARFFEVELRKVTRLRNDILLNEDAVRSYISQVAPVPFDHDLSVGQEIDLELEKRGIRPPIHIELADGRGQIFHRLRNSFPLSETASDEIRQVEFVELVGNDGEICAFGWIAEHSYAGSIPKRLGLSGIRLRSGNIQVGDESILASLFQESRFCGWAIGDIHVLSPKILPNGRRDEFEPTIAYAHLQGELTLHAKKITQRIRDRSAERNQVRVVQQHSTLLSEWLQVSSDKVLPTMITKIVSELARERLSLLSKEIAKLNVGSESHQAMVDQQQKLGISLKNLEKNTPNKTKRSRISQALKAPISAALKTILSTAKSPEAGVNLSIEVLAAIEKAL